MPLAFYNRTVHVGALIRRNTWQKFRGTARKDNNFRYKMTVTETGENRLSYETKSHFLPFYFITNLGIVGYTKFSLGISLSR